MTILKRTATFLIAVSLLSLAGCAATSERESSGEYIDDSVITSKVKAAFLNEPSLKVFDIKVETYRNAVQLTGAVGSFGELVKAGDLARSVSGVRWVRNDLTLK